MGKFRMIVITGPKHGGKGQLVRTVRETGEQMLDLEQLSIKDSPSQECFETLLFNKLLQFTVSRVVWIVYQIGELGNIMLSKKMKETMSRSGRVHVETSLEERIKFIIKDFPCICKNLNNVEAAMKDVAKAAEKTKDETWEEVVTKFEDKEDLARDLMDVDKMLNNIGVDDEDNMEGHIFFIGRPEEEDDDDRPRFVED